MRLARTFPYAPEDQDQSARRRRGDTHRLRAAFSPEARSNPPRKTLSAVHRQESNRQRRVPCLCQLRVHGQERFPRDLGRTRVPFRIHLHGQALAYLTANESRQVAESDRLRSRRHVYQGRRLDNRTGSGVRLPGRGQSRTDMSLPSTLSRSS
jgi:hypothetical protein